MSTTYNAVSGDTFEKIAIKKYGDSSRSDNIARSNPSISEPIPSGTKIVIPELSDVPKDKTSTSNENGLNDVTILINGKKFDYWDQVVINRVIDSIDSIALSAPLEVEAPGFKESFKPLAFNDITVMLGDSPLFTGTMVNVQPSLTSNSKRVTATGYSKPGVLNDCTPPAATTTLNALEFSGQGLIEISKAICDPFGIATKFEVEQGSIFEQVACTPVENVLDFLSKLTKQRNIIMSSNESGELLFLQETKNYNPVAVLREGEPPLESISVNFNPQSYYSDITGIEPTIIGFLEGQKYTVKNTNLDKIRPMSFMVNDTNAGDLKSAVEARAGRMYANTVKYDVTLPTWRDSNNELWKPNTIIKVIAPDVMIYKEYDFLIRSVEFTKTAESEVSRLSLVLPGSYSGRIPEELPWVE